MGMVPLAFHLSTGKAKMGNSFKIKESLVYIKGTRPARTT